MKNFSEKIDESVINIPEFNHPQLKDPQDLDGRFWVAIANANDPDNEVSKQQLEKIIKGCKDVYSSLAMWGGEYQEMATCLTDMIKQLDKKLKTAVSTTSDSDIKSLRTTMTVVKEIDSSFSSHRWYNKANVSIKAGYVPFRGSVKDTKIKFRFIVRSAEPFSQSQIQSIKHVCIASPLTADYIAGIEFNKDNTAFQILISNTPGYKR